MKQIVNENASINFKIVPETKKVKVNEHECLLKDFNKLDLIGSNGVKIGSFEDFDNVEDYIDISRYCRLKNKNGFDYFDSFCTKSFTVEIIRQDLSIKYMFNINLETMKVSAVKSIVSHVFNTFNFVDRFVENAAINYEANHQYDVEYKKLSKDNIEKAKQNIADNLVIIPEKNPVISIKNSGLKKDRCVSIFLDDNQPELLCKIRIYDSKNRLLADFGDAYSDHRIHAILSANFGIE